MPLLPETSSSTRRQFTGFRSRTSSSSSSPSSYSWDDVEPQGTSVVSESSQGIEALLRFMLNRRPPSLSATRTDTIERNLSSNIGRALLTRNGFMENVEDAENTAVTFNMASNHSETIETGTDVRTLDPYGPSAHNELVDMLERITQTEQVSTSRPYNQPSLLSQAITEYNRNNYEAINPEETMIGPNEHSSNNMNTEDLDFGRYINEPGNNSQTTIVRQVMQQRQNGPSWVVAEFRHPPRRSQLSTMTTADNETTETTTYQETESIVDTQPHWVNQNPDDPANNFMVMLRWREERVPTTRPELRNSRLFNDLETPGSTPIRSKLLMAISSKSQMKSKALSYVTSGTNFNGRLVAPSTCGIRDRYNVIPLLEQECYLRLGIRRVDAEHNRVTCVLRKMRDNEIMAEDVWEGEMLEGPYRGESAASKTSSRPRTYNLTSFWKYLYPNHSLNGTSLVEDTLHRRSTKTDYTSASEMLQRASSDYVWLILRNTTFNGCKLEPQTRRQQLLLSVNRNNGSVEGCLRMNYKDNMLVYLEPELICRHGGCPDVTPC